MAPKQPSPRTIAQDQKRQQNRDLYGPARYDREALAAACDQCGVFFGAVECESSIADGFVVARKQENGVEIAKTVSAQWVMTSNREALIYVGA